MGQDPICIFGGAFDPIHIGHLIIAEDVRAMRRLTRVFFIPCSIPPTKEPTEAGPEDRLAMVQLATEGNPAFEVSDLEVKRKGISYTVETVRDVRARFGEERKLYLLLGMDQLNAMETWHDPEEIVGMCTILAVRRPGHEERAIPACIMGSVEVLATRSIEISSTEIRERVHLGRSIRHMVPDAVLDYIYLKGLYGARREGDVLM